jgi:serine protease AprX
MASLSREFIANILLLGRGGPRLLNESAVLLTVWAAYADAQDRPVDLLLTPIDSQTSSGLARHLYERLKPGKARAKEPWLITPIQGAVAARLNFEEFYSLVLPLTGLDLAAAIRELQALTVAAQSQRPDPESSDREETSPGPTLAEMFFFAGAHEQAMTPDLRAALAVLAIAAAHDVKELPSDAPAEEWTEFGSARPGRSVCERVRHVDEHMIWRVSTNRPVEHMAVSTETIKADAARRVFEVDCRSLTWAVIDSGIDGSHPAFRDHEAGGFAIRVDKAYDFGSLRRIASYDTLLDPAQRDALLALIRDRLHMDVAAAEPWLRRLQEDAELGRIYDWEALSSLLEVPADQLPAPAGGGKPNGHGTHVAGVLAGDWRDGDRHVYRGVCPNLRLYDLRILGGDQTETEFAIISALAFIRWLNSRNRYMVIHGANLSIGLRHELESYACGRTPVCMACEATIASGVTVVAAAGNWGSQDFQLATGGNYRGYAAISIADPGNAASVITVGATHRERPHEYGVSFFSSRGPTGDGRAKPDVVAPGERIDGPLPDLGFGRLDGTSMAAPHVSGIAALLMARNPEMIGDPGRVKTVIVATATDLGRERHFQGAGLVDALRALQAV